jgi:hypothetical protein
VVAEPGQPIEERVLASPAVEVLQPVAILGESVDLVQHRHGHPGHHDRDDERADGEEQERDAAPRTIAGPKPLHGRNAHEQDEFDRHDSDHPATDRRGCLADGRFRWVGVGLVGHVRAW